jgi:hypothetical protein
MRDGGAFRDNSNLFFKGPLPELGDENANRDADRTPYFDQRLHNTSLANLQYIRHHLPHFKKYRSAKTTRNA